MITFLKNFIKKNFFLYDLLIKIILIFKYNKNWRVFFYNTKKDLKFNFNTLKQINENSNIHIISKNKTNQEIFDLFNELIQAHRDQHNLKKIESLEQKLINNLDESSYSELIKLKSQLNRD